MPYEAPTFEDFVALNDLLNHGDEDVAAHARGVFNQMLLKTPSDIDSMRNWCLHRLVHESFPSMSRIAKLRHEQNR